MPEREKGFSKSVLTPLCEALTAVAMVVTVLVVLLVVADVFMRRFFNAPIRGTYEITSLAFSMVVYLPMAWCALKDGHIRLDVLVSRMPKAAQEWLEVFSMVLSFCAMGLVSWQLFKYGNMIRVSNSQSALLGIPTFPFIYLASFGAAVFAVTFLVKFLEAVGKIGGARK